MGWVEEVTIGDKLGPYEILVQIGAGGMGDVYKARDTRLDRIVAIKVSKTEFSERFEREARAVAALNHSNICTLHDVGPNYLVMEYIEGTPLKGPLPVDQALKHAVQICDALDAAHKKGITHRDLKPANILVTKAGIKLLDFGLAKLGSSGIGPAAKPPDDATLTMALTGKNEIVGTLYYMSPEQLQTQANGQEIDSRSDIFSFGLVLYEMLTGKRAFEGSSPASVIAAIMERPVPSIAEIVPPALDRVLKTCLAKDPDERWQSARDLKRELEWIASGSGEAATVPSATTGQRLLPWIAAAVLAVVSAGLAFVHLREKLPSPPLSLRFEIPPPPNARIANQAALSPDGRLLAFTVPGADGTALIWIHPLNGLQSRPLPGSQSNGQPFFWSPDSRFIAYSSSAQLKRIDVSGGSPEVICDAPDGVVGGAWTQDGIIIFGQATGPLMRVSQAGGVATPVTALNSSRQERNHSMPVLLPDNRHVIYPGASAREENTAVYLASLEEKPGEGTGKLLISSPVGAAYVPSQDSGLGHLLFMRDGTQIADQRANRRDEDLPVDTQPVMFNNAEIQRVLFGSATRTRSKNRSC